jgi:enoyl-CoA hydratase/carnithine racemase
VFQDKPHFAFGIVPGAGIHSLWPEVLGSIRGRTFVLTQQIIGVKEARALGVISEIVPATVCCIGREKLPGALPTSLR